MASRDTSSANRPLDALPQLPLDAAHWKAIFLAMRLSPRQAEIAELLARGAHLKEIAAMLKITVPTVRTQLERIFNKTGTRNRGEFLLQILDVSHRVGACRCRH